MINTRIKHTMKRSSILKIKIYHFIEYLKLGNRGKCFDTQKKFSSAQLSSKIHNRVQKYTKKLKKTQTGSTIKTKGLGLE